MPSHCGFSLHFTRLMAICMSLLWKNVYLSPVFFTISLLCIRELTPPMAERRWEFLFLKDSPSVAGMMHPAVRLQPRLLSCCSVMSKLTRCSRIAVILHRQHSSKPEERREHELSFEESSQNLHTVPLFKSHWPELHLWARSPAGEA